ncbi:MAG: patatin-like phospholipase family protein [Roseiarcus sp.]
MDAAPRRKRINVALQGGGSHGAYSWGVLDALLEDDRLDIGAISGASAGAMNAVVVAEGRARGGLAGARRALHDFWLSISEEGALSPIQRKWFDLLFGNLHFSGSPAFELLDGLANYASPYDLNPLNLNPLRDHLVKMVDFDLLRRTDGPALFIAATNVHTGKGAIFRRPILTADHVMASACLPRLFQAVELDGAPYWDGGFAGNPPLWPLIYETDCLDAIIVQINPIERRLTPRTSREIVDRTNEITFNSALLAELRAVKFVIKLLDEGALDRTRYKRMRIHRIGGDGRLEAFGAATKVDTSWPFLKTLRDLGRQSAQEWLAVNFAAIGERGTLDLDAEVS